MQHIKAFTSIKILQLTISSTDNNTEQLAFSYAADGCTNWNYFRKTAKLYLPKAKNMLILQRSNSTPRFITSRTECLRPPKSYTRVFKAALFKTTNHLE